MHESETIEFKKSLAELGEALNSMAAILNKHGGGEIWFGIRNDGRPVGMDVSETTLRKVSQAIAAHIEPKIYPEASRRRNPLIADLLRRIHLIEAWGRGIPLILEKAPNVRFSQVAGIFITEFPRPVDARETQSEILAGTQSGAQSGARSGAQSRQILIQLESEPLSANQLANQLGLETKTGAFKRSTKELIEGGLIEYTLPETPNSRLQKYRLTPKGRAKASETRANSHEP